MVWKEKRIGVHFRICSGKEKEVGKGIVEEFKKVVDYSGSEKDATFIETLGALNGYYYFVRESMYQEMEVKFISCKIKKNEGTVWIRIIGHENDKTTKDMLECSIVKIGSEWYVISVKAV